MGVLAQISIAVAMVLLTVVALVRFQRSLDRPGGRAGLGSIGDALGNAIDVFDPGQARADRELKRHHDAGPVSPVPDEEDEDPIRLLTHPDGTPRAVRLRRPAR